MATRVDHTVHQRTKREATASNVQRCERYKVTSKPVCKPTTFLHLKLFEVRESGNVLCEAVGAHPTIR